MNYIEHNLIAIPIQLEYKDNKKFFQPLIDFKNIKTIQDLEDKINEKFSCSIDEYYSKHDNFALLTGKVNNITVIDVDDPAKYEQLLKELEIENISEVKTITNNGYHLYFEYDPELKTKSNYLNIKLDVRNDGGLITIPPSSYEKDGQMIEYIYEEGTEEENIKKIKNLEKIEKELKISLMNDIKKMPIKIKIDKEVLFLKEKLQNIKELLLPINDKLNDYNLLFQAISSVNKYLNGHVKGLNLLIKIFKGLNYVDEIETIWDRVDLEKAGDLNKLIEIVNNIKINSEYLYDNIDNKILYQYCKMNDLNDIMCYLNKYYCIITSSNTGKILYCEKTYKQGKLNSLQIITTRDNFINKIPSSCNICINPEKKKYQPILLYWLDSIHRKEYRDIEFEPNSTNKNKLNLFLGFKHFEVEDYKVDELIITNILYHLKYIICNNNEEVYEFMLDWLSYIIQKPNDRMGIAILCKSEQGTGKNLFFEKFIGENIIGIHSACYEASQVVGKFNSLISDKIYIVINEIEAEGELIKTSNKMKSLITDKTQKLEKKGIDAIQINNYCNYVLLTNNNNVIKVEEGDRRYLCLEASSCKRGNSAYYKKLAEDIDDIKKGECFYHMLKTRDLSGFNPKSNNIIPMTDYKKELIYVSKPKIKKWFEDYLENQKTGTKLEYSIKVRELYQKFKESEYFNNSGFDTFQMQIEKYNLKKENGYYKYKLDEI